MVRSARRARRPTPVVDYHPYVFRDGQFVGAFEAMYQEATVVPWHQDESVRRWPAAVALALVAAQAPFARALDVGCGLGYFTAQVAPYCHAIEGLDVSPTAIRRARALFPTLAFAVADCRQPVLRPPATLVILREVLWYVLPALSTVLAHAAQVTAADGWCLVCQSFPPAERPFYGQAVLPTPAALVTRLQAHWTVWASCVAVEHEPGRSGSILLALLRKAVPQAASGVP